ncbi:hypothetical protein LZ554_004026 [Drepanopeziza brunnea f. sp. 'monogermtubi']|nr:hypothetical protein LZ554_004026 [Drepanopeziza brunnea f. sp. 'monogermtubi']
MAQARIQHDARDKSEQLTERVQVLGAFRHVNVAGTDGEGKAGEIRDDGDEHSKNRGSRTAVSPPASSQSLGCQRSKRGKIACPPMKARKFCAEESIFPGTTTQVPTPAVIMNPRSTLIHFGNVTLKSFAADMELAVIFFLAA